LILPSKMQRIPIKWNRLRTETIIFVRRLKEEVKFEGFLGCWRRAEVLSEHAGRAERKTYNHRKSSLR
jgi:hypothetical protein